MEREQFKQELKQLLQENLDIDISIIEDFGNKLRITIKFDGDALCSDYYPLSFLKEGLAQTPDEEGE